MDSYRKSVPPRGLCSRVSCRSPKADCGLEHQVQIQGTQHYKERNDTKEVPHWHPQDHKPVQVKCTRKPFPEVHNSSSQPIPESCNCLTTVSKNIHKFKLSSNYMDNISKTVDNTQNNNKNQVMILSCWDISFDTWVIF